MAPDVALTTMRMRLMLRLFDWLRIAFAPLNFPLSSGVLLACIGSNEYVLLSLGAEISKKLGTCARLMVSQLHFQILVASSR